MSRSKSAFAFRMDQRLGENLKRLIHEYPEQAEKALHREALAVEKESRRRTPVGKSGALRASHQTTTTAKGLATEIASTIRVGGPAAPYAVHVHYRDELRHNVGESRFLEMSLNAAKHDLLKNVGKRIEDAIKGKVRR